MIRKTSIFLGRQKSVFRCFCWTLEELDKPDIKISFRQIFAPDVQIFSSKLPMKLANDVLMKFALDNQRYFNFNNLFEISLNGAFNRRVFKILIYSKWPWNPNSLPGQAFWAASRPRWLVRERNLGFIVIWNKSISWTPPCWGHHLGIFQINC